MCKSPALSIRRASVPVIDLFAGPGGLGEGFASFRRDGSYPFRISLSIEKERWAHQTLTLRSFFRQFRDRVPAAYYRFLHGHLTLRQLYGGFPREAAASRKEAWLAELGRTVQREVDQRISEALGGVKTWALIGGPPCQAYSLAGRSRRRNDRQFATDEKHTLYRHYLHILARHEPPVFVMENVKGLLSSKHEGTQIMQRIMEDLRRPRAGLHYRLLSFTRESSQSGRGDLLAPKDFVLACERFGAPQRRHRVIILGVRADLDVRHFKPLSPSAEAISLSQALAGLPRIRSRLSDGPDSALAWRSALRELADDRLLLKDLDPTVAQAIRRTVDMLAQAPVETGGEFLGIRSRGRRLPCGMGDGRLRAACNHTGRSHIRQDLHRYLFAACFARSHQRSPTLSEFPRDLLPFHKNVASNLGRDLVFADRFRVQLADQPSTTIAAHIAKDGHYYIHPDPLQCRSLTVREAARLQTFPDNYFFCGPRTSQYGQVGNAVPPFVAGQLAAVVDRLLQGQASD
jgi:DNA (cytosine-5)-methyltransferase 1